MPVSMLKETSAVIGADAGKCDSRSLLLDRFADPCAKDSKESTPRKAWFNRLINKTAVSLTPRTSWHPPGSTSVHARLMSRLMINMAGGVMENANLLLDRYGLPLIPGSAVKGCARRMALQALHDWIESQQNKGSAERPAPDDACAPCCEGFETPAHMLAAIARVFGWTPEDWKEAKKDRRYKSDFDWACSSAPREQNTLAQGTPPANESSPEGANQRIQTIFTATRALLSPHDTFAGTIAFLPANPNRDPRLELDVVTPHHTEYYQSSDPKAVATDTEDPVPVFFPAVKPQNEKDFFTFPLIPLRRARPDDLAHAKRWLAHGLELLGLGAKTNAGYGWFDASPEFQKEVEVRLEANHQAEVQRNLREAEEARKKEEDRKRQQARDEKTEATKNMTTGEKADWELKQLSPAQFAAKLQAFFKEPKKGGPSEEERKAIVRALRGPRLEVWTDFKAKAIKGDLAKAADAVRALNKQLHGDKMP